MSALWSNVRHTLLKPDGSFHADLLDKRIAKAGYARMEALKNEVSEWHPYTYTLTSGETQTRIVAIHGEEREWRWRMCKWLPFPRKINRVINIDFHKKAGERSGRWKDNAIGIIAEWHKGETMLEALQRCEQTDSGFFLVRR